MTGEQQLRDLQYCKYELSFESLLLVLHCVLSPSLCVIISCSFLLLLIHLSEICPQVLWVLTVGHQVCPSSFICSSIQKSLWVFLCLLFFFFSHFLFLLFSDQIRPTIGLLCQRHSCASLVTGTGSPCCASAYTWHHRPSLAFIMADEHKLINMYDKFKQVCCLCSLLLFLLLSFFDYRLVLWWVCFTV